MKHNELQRVVLSALDVQGNGFSIVRSNKRGVPDIIGHIGIIFIAVEVKVGKDKLSNVQRAILLDINNQGAIGIVVHEKHLKVFHEYIQRIKRELTNGTLLNIIGKPIPKELLVEPFKDVYSTTVTEL